MNLWITEREATPEPPIGSRLAEPCGTAMTACPGKNGQMFRLAGPQKSAIWAHDTGNRDQGEGWRDDRAGDAVRAELHHHLVRGHQEGCRDRPRWRRAENSGGDQADRRDRREDL